MTPATGYSSSSGNNSHQQPFQAPDASAALDLTGTSSQSPTTTNTSPSNNNSNSNSSCQELNLLLDALAAKFSNEEEDVFEESLHSPQSPHTLPHSSDFLQQFRYTYANREFCKDYCPAVFRKLRALCGISEREFRESLLNTNYQVLGKNLGKSGSLLFKTADEKYFIKTIDKNEKTFLVSTLPAYFHYLSYNPSSFLLKIFAIFRIRLTPLKSVHFAVTKSVLPPGIKVSELYDLKGSTAGRLRKENEFIRKDLDLKRKFAVGPVRQDIYRQIVCDSKYLQSVHVMDYSLLLGVVRRPKSQRRNGRNARNPTSTPSSALSRHSLSVRPEVKRQSVSLSTISQVLHTSESLLSSINGDDASEDELSSIGATTPDDGKPSLSPLSVPQKGRQRTPTTPNGTRVAKLAQEYEKRLQVDASPRSRSKSASDSTKSHKNQHERKALTPTPVSHDAKRSKSFTTKKHVKSASTGSNKKRVNPLPTSNSSSSSSGSPHSPSLGETGKMGHNRSFLQRLKKDTEEGKETKGFNPIGQLLSSKFNFFSLSTSSKRSTTGSTSSKKSSPSNGGRGGESSSSTGSNRSSSSSSKSHDLASIDTSKKYTLKTEPVQTLKSIQPKYLLTAHVSQALLKKRDIWTEGFPVVRQLPTRSSTSSMGSTHSNSSSTSSSDEYEEEVFFGIIDISQQYNTKKKAALMLRSLQYDPSEQSSIEPSSYAKRFQRFMSGIFVE